MSLDLNFNLRPIDGNKHFTCARILTFHIHERMPPDHPHTCLFPRAIFYTVYSCSQQQQKNAEYLSGTASNLSTNLYYETTILPVVKMVFVTPQHGVYLIYYLPITRWRNRSWLHLFLLDDFTRINRNRRLVLGYHYPILFHCLTL